MSSLSWAQRRRLVFVGWLLVLCITLLGVYALIAFMSEPSCGNGERDGDERGIDCGGACLRVCKADVQPLLVHFVRTLEVTDGIWGAVAYGENRNDAAGARAVPYRFKLYDGDNLLIYDRRGVAFIPPRKVFAVFEGQMRTGNRTPTRATFEFLREPTFEKMDESKLSVSTKDFEAGESGSSLQAIVSNASLQRIEGIEATALLFGPDGNVIGASATILKQLPGQSSATLTFTWPKELETPSRIEVLYTVHGR